MQNPLSCSKAFTARHANFRRINHTFVQELLTEVRYSRRAAERRPLLQNLNLIQAIPLALRPAYKLLRRKLWYENPLKDLLFHSRGWLQTIGLLPFPCKLSRLKDGHLHRIALPYLSRQNPKRLRLAVVNAGGIGDALALTPLVAAIRREFPEAEIIFFHTNPAVFEIYRDNSCVDGIYHFNKWAPLLVRTLTEHRHLFDAVFDCRYSVRIHVRRHACFPSTRLRHNQEAMEPFDAFHETLPRFNFGLSQLAEDMGLDALSLGFFTAGLDGGETPSLQLFLQDHDFDSLDGRREGAPYVTVHHGADPRMAGGYQTKTAPLSFWTEIVRLLRQHGLQVFQIGLEQETAIPHTDQRFKGTLNLHETACLLKGARLHLDTEGGLVHLARAVHTRSVVLFGPTPVGFFGYPQNINLTAGDCHECWWSTPDWFKSCPLEKNPPECMASFSTTQVFQKIAAALDAVPCPSLLLERSGPGEDSLPASDNGQRKRQVAVIGTNHVSGFGIDVTRCDVLSFVSTRPPSSDGGSPSRLGTPFCLPVEDASFDEAWISFPLHLQQHPQEIVREAVRILRPDGRLVLPWGPSGPWGGASPASLSTFHRNFGGTLPDLDGFWELTEEERTKLSPLRFRKTDLRPKR